MSPKRKTSDASENADPDFSASPPAPAKRVRKSAAAAISSSAPAAHTIDSLLALSHDDLAKHALDLHTQLSALQQGGGGEVWTEEKVPERAKKTRDVCAAEIKKQMKWQPTCKTGTTKWSYTGLVPHEDVFYKLFGFEKPKKAWKQKKIDIGDFENKDRLHQQFGRIPELGSDKSGEVLTSRQIRYNLRITGDAVKVHWDQEEKTFKLSGTYGL